MRVPFRISSARAKETPGVLPAKPPYKDCSRSAKAGQIVAIHRRTVMIRHRIVTIHRRTVTIRHRIVAIHRRIVTVRTRIVTVHRRTPARCGRIA
jgi:hypothetical protein